LIDAGDGERLERWGPYRLRRPDPRAAGRRALSAGEWRQVDAAFSGEAGRGRWDRHTEVPERWTITHGGITLVVKLAPFKHTGVFPEQAEHWQWMTRVATGARPAGAITDPSHGGATRRALHILNLFAYTGGATMALAKAGHKVTHVDASQPALTWARENAAANGLPADAVRWIQDDAATFVRRERRRGRRYDAVLMDPPAFGHAPNGGVWRVEDQLAPLVAETVALLDDPVFLLINHYAKAADPHELAALITEVMRNHPGRQESGRLRLRTSAGAPLETGVYVRWRAAGA
jgi:23S rRNA (cytosine1962-C5)-methyltransferase